MILKLVVPSTKTGRKVESRGVHFEARVYGLKIYDSLLGAIPVIAGLTPKGIDIRICDENIEDIDFDEKVDLVGITAHTSSVNRAYKIADEFRKRGVKVVMGGVHVSMLPEEALRHCDSVVVGEAENVWKGLLSDFNNKNLKKIYKSEIKADLESQPIPRYDLLRNDMYRFDVIETMRGCPYGCEFCSAQIMFGGKTRCKSVRRVVKEVKLMNSISRKYFAFTDNIFDINRQRAIDILKKLISLKVHYSVMSTISIYRDEELLDLLVESGCTKIVIGFESLNSERMKRLNKLSGCSIDEFYKAIEKCQSKGLCVMGTLMLGFDEDDVSVFENTVKFVKDSGVVYCGSVAIVTPLPGTILYKKLEHEGRILHKDWTYYDYNHVCFKPKKLSVKDLQDGFYWTNQQIYDLNALYKRTIDLYKLWNRNGKRYFDRPGPMIENIELHELSSSYPAVPKPEKKD